MGTFSAQGSDISFTNFAERLQQPRIQVRPVAVWTRRMNDATVRKAGKANLKSWKQVAHFMGPARMNRTNLQIIMLLFHKLNGHKSARRRLPLVPRMATSCGYPELSRRPNHGRF